MTAYDKVVRQDLIYVLILVGLASGSLLALIFAVKKFGLKRTCRAIRYVVSLQFIFQFIIYLRVRFFQGPAHVISSGIDNIVLNDEEYVKNIMKDEGED